MPLCDMGRRGRSEDVARLDRLVSSGDLETFIEIARTAPLYKASRNELMYNLDTGLAEVFTGSYRDGVKKLVRVGDMSEEFYTKSITRHVLSVLTNNSTLPYYGEDYEVTFAGVAAAIGFAAQGKMEDALVEIRRSEHRLTVMSDVYEGSDKYRDDGFAHYLAGMLYEAAGRHNDALVSYRLADAAYGSRFFPMKPPELDAALRDAARRSGISIHNPAETPVDAGDADIPAAVSPAGITSENTVPGEPEAAPRLFVFAFTGRGPVKRERVIQAHFTNEGVDYVVKIALPEIAERISSIRGARVTVDGETVKMACAADYNHIAANAFRDKLPLVFATTLARVSARYLLLKEAKEDMVKKLKEKHEKAKEKHGDDSDEADAAWLRYKTASLALDLLANELLERADTRCSLLLPERAFCARLPAAAGDSCTVAVEYLDARGSVIGKESRRIGFEPGRSGVAVFSELR